MQFNCLWIGLAKILMFQEESLYVTNILFFIKYFNIFALFYEYFGKNLCYILRFYKLWHSANPNSIELYRGSSLFSILSNFLAVESFFLEILFDNIKIFPDNFVQKYFWKKNWPFFHLSIYIFRRFFVNIIVNILDFFVNI